MYTDNLHYCTISAALIMPPFSCFARTIICNVLNLSIRYGNILHVTVWYNTQSVTTINGVRFGLAFNQIIWIWSDSWYIDGLFAHFHLNFIELIAIRHYIIAMHCVCAYKKKYVHREPEINEANGTRANKHYQMKTNAFVSIVNDDVYKIHTSMLSYSSQILSQTRSPIFLVSSIQKFISITHTKINLLHLVCFAANCPKL